MNLRKNTKKISEEFIANVIGWVAGLVSVDLLSHFFAIRSWKNGWGLFSRKTMIDADTFNLIEWIITAIFGFIVLYSVNKLILSKLLYKTNKDAELKKETELKEKKTNNLG